MYVSLAIPQDCFLCEMPSQDILCEACQNDLPLHEPHKACPRCGMSHFNAEPCGACLKCPPPFDSVHAVFRYDFPVSSLITDFKYAANLRLTEFLGQKLAKLAKESSASRILPLPLHKDRMAERGFNQAHELAKVVAKVCKIPLSPELCERVSLAGPQARLPFQRRAKNIKNAFFCTQPKLTEPILLIDDVMTTGASVAECAKTLKLHGAPRVDVLVLARTQKRLFF